MRLDEISLCLLIESLVIIESTSKARLRPKKLRSKPNNKLRWVEVQKTRTMLGSYNNDKILPPTSYGLV
nr:hypothetical protein Itr_chr04CG09000 [Ipomoea trifida]